MMNKNLKAKIKALPQRPGVYIFKDKVGRILYIGKAANLRQRVRSHFSQDRHIFKGKLLADIKDIDWIKSAGAKEALLLENQLIKKYQPKFNIQWRDDKSYFWVAFTNDEWPRVQIVHQTALLRHPERSEGSPANAGRHKVGDSSASGLRMTTQLGPFVSGTELKKTLRALRKIFPYRTCKNPYNKPCLQGHLGLCPAHKSVNSKQLTVNSYKNSLGALSQILRLYAGDKNIRIEAYDISNIHGAYATGSMIVFRGRKPQRADYRRFKIKTVRGANDVAMLKEVLRRRLKHLEWPYPDLIVIDGGLAQLNAVNKVIRGYKLDLSVIALAKKEEELYTEFSNRNLPLRSLPTELQLVFQAIRNEAHRFAIFYYRHLHAKQFRRAAKKVRKTR